MTYAEVLKAGKNASWRNDREEFVYLAAGIMYWRPLDPRRSRVYCCSLPVQDRTLPDEGWSHEQPCDCEFCRGRQAADR